LNVFNWRPAPAWLAAGLVLGPFCGAVVGATLVTVGSAMDGYGLDASSAAAGLRIGAYFGLVIGVVAGLALTLLAGPHLPVQQARERAFLLCFCSTGLFTFPVSTILFAFHPIGILIAFGSALAVGTLGYRLASWR
jgi:hypothetical protein